MSSRKRRLNNHSGDGPSSSKLVNVQPVPLDVNTNREIETSKSEISPSAIDAKSTNTDMRLAFKFYDQQCISLAKALLGKSMTRQLPTGEVISGVIVETEAYLGTEDKAAHSFEGKKTPKNSAMFEPPGTAYVYNIYGMYCCMNI